MIFTKDYASISDEEVNKVTRELKLHYRAFIVSFIYLLYTRVDLSSSVHKLSKLSSSSGKVHFEVLVNLLRYIRDNMNLCLKYYDDMKDEPLSDMFIQANMNNDKKLMAYYDSSWKYCPDTDRRTGAYIIFYQGESIYNVTHFPGPVSQSSVERD